MPKKRPDLEFQYAAFVAKNSDHYVIAVKGDLEAAKRGAKGLRGYVSTYRQDGFIKIRFSRRVGIDTFRVIRDRAARAQ